MIYILLKFSHVLAAIIAVGTNITYGVWIVRGKNQVAQLLFALRGIKFIDNYLANPAYAALLITGWAMARVSGYSLATPWLAMALTLYTLVVMIGLIGYTPTLRQQIETLEQEGIGSVIYAVLAKRGHRLGATIGILVIAILYLMVFKPA